MKTTGVFINVNVVYYSLVIELQWINKPEVLLIWAILREGKNDNNNLRSVAFMSSRKMTTFLNRCVQLGVKLALLKLAGLSKAFKVK